MIVPFAHVLLFAALLFVMGLGCVLARRNLIMILIGVEIMLNAAAVALVGGSAHWRQVDGQVFVVFLMAMTFLSMQPAPAVRNAGETPVTSPLQRYTITKKVHAVNYEKGRAPARRSRPRRQCRN